MVEKQGAGNDQSNRRDAASSAEEGVPVERAIESAHTAAVTPANHRPRWKQRLGIGVLAALVLAAIWKFGVPWIELTLNTVSTDDAYVNGHVTFVAARVSGQIARVLVDDNNRVHKGDILAQLDNEPYEVAVAEKRAAVETAKADLLAATAAVRGLEAQPEAYVGNCSTPWRMSKIGWPPCTLASPPSIKAKPPSSWQNLNSHERSNYCRTQR
jgi:Biotin-lipoyl like